MELRSAARVWSETCSGLDVPRFEFYAGPPRLSVARDGRNVVRMRSGTWCPDHASDRRDCYSRERAAITHSYGLQAPLSDEVRPITIEADIEINAVHYSWAAESGSAQGPLGRLLVHELGHVLGLTHSCSGPACATNGVARASVMYPNPLEGAPRMRPTGEDCAALGDLYPARSPPVSWTLLVSSCLAIVMAAAFGAWRGRRRKARSSASLGRAQGRSTGDA